MSEARPPTTFRWAGAEEKPDVIVFIVPPWPDYDAPERLTPVKAVRLLASGRLYLFSQDDGGVFWAPGVFTSVTVDQRPDCLGGFYIHPDQYDPHSVGSSIDAALRAEPDLLWSFIGSARTAPVRAELLALEDERAVIRDSTTPWQMQRPERDRLQAEYADILVRSRFVACPRGFAPSTHRLFETMRAGRAPVVLSDAWRPPPFVEWDSCVVRVPEADARHLPEILREREGDAAGLGCRAREVWEERLSPQGMVHQLVESCLLLHERRQTSATRALLALRAIPNRRTYRKARAVIRTEWAARRGRLPA